MNLSRLAPSATRHEQRCFAFLTRANDNIPRGCISFRTARCFTETQEFCSQRNVITSAFQQSVYVVLYRLRFHSQANYLCIHVASCKERPFLSRAFSSSFNPVAPVSRISDQMCRQSLSSTRGSREISNSPIKNSVSWSGYRIVDSFTGLLMSNLK